MNFDLQKHLILLNIHGSRAYGMHTSYSDVDVKGVLIAPKAMYLGFNQKVEQVDSSTEIAKLFDLLNDEEKKASQKEKLEGTVHELQKFLYLASQANPNILEALFCREEEIRLITSAGQELRDNRNIFLSTKAYHTYTQYAYAQLKKIKTHRAWLLNPPKQQPTREHFNLGARTLLPKDQMGAFETLVQKATANGQTREQAIIDTMEFLGIHGSALELLAAEKSYEHAKTQWQSYCQWKKHRNKDRAKLEEKFGYDTKHASHLVRLLRTGNDLLKTGQLHVYRPDAEELLQIRNGHWSYDQLEEYAETVQQELHAFYDSGKSPLPKKPNINKIDELCIKLIEQSLSNNHK